MQEFMNWFTSTPVIALVVSIIVFLITLTLVVKRLIGFFITLLLLFFTIVSGYAILNHQIVSDYLQNYHQESEAPVDKQQEKNLQEKLLEGFNSLKKEFDEFQNKYMEKSSKDQPADQ